MKSTHKTVMQSAAFGAALGLLLTACGGDNNAVDATPVDAPPEEGTVSLSWAVDNAGAALTCDDVLGVVVRVTARPVEGGTGYPEAFGCDVGSGTSSAIPANEYNVEVVLTTSNNRPLTEPIEFPNVAVLPGQNTPLGDVVFQVVPEGSVEFTIDTGAAAGNCALEADGGAELSEFRIDYINAQGQCVPATFTIADGANRPGGTYVSDCAIARALCIDADQVVRAENVPSGTVSMNIVGYRGVDECYTRMPLFSVPGNGLLTELAPQLLTPVGPCVPAP